MAESIRRSEQGSPTPSVDKALEVLQLLAGCSQGLSLSGMAALTGLPKGSLHRTLAALRYRGFVSQDPSSRKYRVGGELLRVAFTAYSNMDLRASVHPVLEMLSTAFGETAHGGALEGHEVVYYDKVEPDRPIRLSSAIGGRNPAHCTALGKASLAYAYPADRQVVEAIHAGRIRLGTRTPKTITRPEELLRELARVRELGYAVDREENETGVRCIGFPLLMGDRPIGAISISGPAHRLSDDVIQEIVPRAAAIIADSMGPEWLPDPLVERFVERG